MSVKKEDKNSYGIYIGANVESVREVKLAIMEILNCKEAQEETKRVALTVLKESSCVNGTHIENCRIEGV